MEVIGTTNFQPDLMIYGLRLGEPVIALTGLLAALVSFYAWLRLGKINSNDDSVKLSRAFFLLTGLSFLVGALAGHAFSYALPPGSKFPGFSLGIIAVSTLAQASIVRTQSLLGPSMTKFLTYLNILELVLALWIISTTIWIKVVEAHTAFGFFLIITPLEVLLLVKTNARRSREVLWGILLLAGAVSAHIFKLSAGVWFCYFDVAHLFVAAAMWKIMQAIALDNAGPSQSSA